MSGKQQQSQAQQGKRILRVQLRDPVSAPAINGVNFSPSTAAYHEAAEDGHGGRVRGVGRATSITLSGQFVVLRLPQCHDVLVPLTQVAYMVPA